MDERARRVGENEALFREVNERIKEIQDLAGHREAIAFVCECGDSECTEEIRLTEHEYVTLRADPLHFAVAHGHVAADVERVVAERETYAIVRKHEGDPAEFAAATDPRS